MYNNSNHKSYAKTFSFKAAKKNALNNLVEAPGNEISLHKKEMSYDCLRFINCKIT